MKLDKHSNWDKKTNNPLDHHYEEKLEGKEEEEYIQILEQILILLW